MDARLAQRPRGSVLIVSLWILVLLGSLAVAVYAHVRPRLLLGSRLGERTKMYYLAHAGFQKALVVLADDGERETYDTLGDPWCDNERVFRAAELGEDY